MIQYSVLYSHQKQKKVKAWKDGYLQVLYNDSKIKLLDENKQVLETKFYKLDVDVGDEIEFLKHIVQVDSVHTGNREPELAAATSSCSSSGIRVTKVKIEVKPFVPPKRVVEDQVADPSVVYYRPGLTEPTNYFNFNKLPIANLKLSSLKRKFVERREYIDYFTNVTLYYLQAMLNDCYDRADKHHKYSGAKVTKLKDFRLFNKNTANLSVSSNYEKDLASFKELNGPRPLLFLDTYGVVTITFSEKQISGDFMKDELYVISTSKYFPINSTVLFRSIFYGLSNNEVQLVALGPHDLETLPRLKDQPLVFAKTMNIGLELAILRNLDGSITPNRFWNTVLNANTDDIVVDEVVEASVIDEGNKSIESIINSWKLERRIELEGWIKEHLNITIERYQLNPDQAAVLTELVHSTFINFNAIPIHLVHGCFGSGKSALIAITLLFLYEISSCFDLKLNVVVCALTNVAVDNVLVKLLNMGFSDFTRVGSKKRIDKRILPYSKFEPNKPGQALDSLESIVEFGPAGAKNFKVIAATCLATQLEIFDFRCELLIMDEVSQLTEPYTLLPLLRFEPKRLLLVGDPHQLPPTLPSDCSATPLLKQTLFDRMLRLGVQALPLTYQYRCHPKIANLSSQLFYDGSLQDGVSASDRKPILNGLPPITFVDCRGKAERSPYSNSQFNQSEVQSVTKLVRHLLDSGVRGSSIGVITFFRSQVEQLEVELLSKKDRGNGLIVSTVDAFQGAERDIIVMSCVASHPDDIKFVANRPRVNVAITRAKFHLILVGNQQVVLKDKVWREIATSSTLLSLGEILALKSHLPVSENSSDDDFDRPNTSRTQPNLQRRNLAKSAPPPDGSADAFAEEYFQSIPANFPPTRSTRSHKTNSERNLPPTASHPNHRKSDPPTLKKAKVRLSPPPGEQRFYSHLEILKTLPPKYGDAMSTSRLPDIGEVGGVEEILSSPPNPEFLDWLQNLEKD